MPGQAFENNFSQLSFLIKHELVYKKILTDKKLNKDKELDTESDCESKHESTNINFSPSK